MSGSGRSGTTQDLLGRAIGEKYELVKLLGHGAMGHVYAARHLTLDRMVAVKVVQVEEKTDPLLVGRFKSEARAASRLDHPNSVQIIDYGEEDGGRLLYIVMELLKGQDLEVVLKRIGRMSETRAANIMSQVLSALVAAHQNSIVHRDLKPANIMLIKSVEDGSEVVKVCDFGIAKLQDPLGSEDPTGMLTLTKAGAVVGTPSYMSPEQAAGKRVDARTDVFSCGVILYRMLTGAKPFRSDTLMGLLSQVMNTEPTPVAQLASTIDGRFVAIVERAMKKDPNERFQSARDMKRAVDEIIATPDRTVQMSATLSGQVMAPGSVVSNARDPAEAPLPQHMSSLALQPNATWARTGTATVLPPPPRKSRTPLVWAGVAAVAVAALTAAAVQLTQDSGDAGRLMEMVSVGSWGSAESYALEHFDSFAHDQTALGLVRDAMRLRRESGVFGSDFPVEFDPSFIPTVGKWRGKATSAERDESQSFNLTIIRVGAGVLEGLLEWPEVGLSAQVRGFYDGNHLLMWDHAVTGTEYYRSQYKLFEKKSLLVASDGTLQGFDGPLRIRWLAVPIP